MIHLWQRGFHIIDFIFQKLDSGLIDFRNFQTLLPIFQHRFIGVCCQNGPYREQFFLDTLQYVLELHKISKSYPEKPILDQFDYTFTKGERVGIIGKNGTGKSTFLNILTGAVQPDAGKVVVGDTIKFGYYTQAGIDIKKGQKVIDVIRDFGDFIPLKKGRQISAQQLLERFLFDRKKQYDFVDKLSGGERKRLYLCTVLIQNPNFLILDEPTNDLDIVTLNVLESFLLDFPGCLIVVSHDRYFMDKIVDHLFVFRGNAVVEDFPGNYSDYRAYEDSKIIEKRKESSESRGPAEADTTATSIENKAPLTYQEKKEHKNLEKDIHKLEKKRTKAQQEFANPDLSGEDIDRLSIALQEIVDEIDDKTERWFELSAKLEE